MTENFYKIEDLSYLGMETYSLLAPCLLQEILELDEKGETSSRLGFHPDDNPSNYLPTPTPFPLKMPTEYWLYRLTRAESLHREIMYYIMNHDEPESEPEWMNLGFDPTSWKELVP